MLLGPSLPIVKSGSYEHHAYKQFKPTTYSLERTAAQCSTCLSRTPIAYGRLQKKIVPPPSQPLKGSVTQQVLSRALGKSQPLLLIYTESSYGELYARTCLRNRAQVRVKITAARDHVRQTPDRRPRPGLRFNGGSRGHLVLKPVSDNIRLYSFPT